MEITEVRVKLVERSSERLRAFCSVTFDGDFVIRDLKIIDGVSGVFVAMPSRKLSDRCPKCGSKNHLRARFCNECGNRLNENRAPKDADGRAKLHADIAHPINAACRERIQIEVVKAYEDELERAKSPDYQPISFDDFDDDFEEHHPAASPAKQTAADDNAAEAEEPLQESVHERRDRGRDHRRDRGAVKEGSGPRDRVGQRDRGDDRNKRSDAPASAGETFGDYNELIADLKREASTRYDDRRAGQAQYGRRERQEVPGHTSDRPADDSEQSTATEDQTDFGEGIQAAEQNRGNQNHQGGRQGEDRARGHQGRSQDSRPGRDKPHRDSDRRNSGDRRDRQDTPAPVEAQKPESPPPAPAKPEPRPAPAKPEPWPAPAPADDDFGAGLV
jgi:stage V sporulation protein G